MTVRSRNTLHESRRAREEIPARQLPRLTNFQAGNWRCGYVSSGPLRGTTARDGGRSPLRTGPYQTSLCHFVNELMESAWNPNGHFPLAANKVWYRPRATVERKRARAAIDGSSDPVRRPTGLLNWSSRGKRELWPETEGLRQAACISMKGTSRLPHAGAFRAASAAPESAVGVRLSRRAGPRDAPVQPPSRAAGRKATECIPSIQRTPARFRGN